MYPVPSFPGGSPSSRDGRRDHGWADPRLLKGALQRLSLMLPDSETRKYPSPPRPWDRPACGTASRRRSGPPGTPTGTAATPAASLCPGVQCPGSSALPRVCSVDFFWCFLFHFVSFKYSDDSQFRKVLAKQCLFVFTQKNVLFIAFFVANCLFG